MKFKNQLSNDVLANLTSQIIMFSLSCILQQEAKVADSSRPLSIDIRDAA
jgi:hypothetical protein